MPLGKAHNALDSLLLSHTGLCKEDSVDILDSNGVVRAIFSCGVRCRTSIYSDARKLSIRKLFGPFWRRRKSLPPSSKGAF